jgi:pyruvate-formate lyase-activating enzyme
MKIASTEYSLQQKTLEIYISGCNPPHCKGCHNSEIWSFDIGSEYNLDYFNTIKDKVEIFDLLIDNI